MVMLSIPIAGTIFTKLTDSSTFTSNVTTVAILRNDIRNSPIEWLFASIRTQIAPPVSEQPVKLTGGENQQFLSAADSNPETCRAPHSHHIT
jgi:hypothetical protein